MSYENSKTRIDRICDRFEEQWKAGDAPSLAKFIGGEHESLGRPLLEELLKLDIHYRQKDGQEVVPAIYSALGLDAVKIAEYILVGKTDEATALPNDVGSENAAAAEAATQAPNVDEKNSTQIGP